MPEAMKGVNFLVLACLLLALAAALPQCLSQEYERKLFATTAIKKDKRSVDLKKVFRPRRSAKDPKKFAQETWTTDEFTVDMPHVFKKPDFVRDHHLYALRGTRKLRSLAEHEGVVAKAWPAQFTITFTTKSGAARGFLSYDWVNRRQVVFHGPNSTFCQNQGTDEACQMLEVPSGTYVYIPSQRTCTLIAEGVGSVPPNWTVQSSYIGVESIPGVGLCRTFSFPPTAHIWGETVDGALPCVFGFPDPSSTYYFDPKSLNLGAPNEELFEFPDFCFGPSGSVESM